MSCSIVTAPKTGRGSQRDPPETPLPEKSSATRSRSLISKAFLCPRPLNGNADNDYARLLRYAEIYEERDPRLTPPHIQIDWDKRRIDKAYKDCGAAADAMIDRMDTPV